MGTMVRCQVVTEGLSEGTEESSLKLWLLLLGKSIPVGYQQSCGLGVKCILRSLGLSTWSWLLLVFGELETLGSRA